MRIVPGFFACAATLALAAFGGGGSNIQAVAKSPQRDFVIAGSNGYGTQECLSAKGRCGQVMADSWCESKGFKGAVAYRKLDTDEITGSSGTNQLTGKAMESFLVSCRE